MHAPHGRDWKGYAAMVMAVLAVISTFRKQPEDGAKAGYIELTTAILESQAAERKNHEDLIAMREYLEDYIREHEAVVVPVPTASSAASPPGPKPEPLTPAPPAWQGSSAKPTIVHVTPISSAVPPPIAPLINPKQPKNVNAIAW
jgi:hypothetical protein